MLTYNAYEKGILPEPGGLGSQPLKFLAMMALLNSRTSEEASNERKRREDGGKPGKQSLTESYLEHVGAGHDDPLAMADPQFSAVPQIRQRKGSVSPDGHAAVPGLLKPRQSIGRR